MASKRVQDQIERFLTEAETAMARLEWETVSQRAQAALSLDPDNVDARTYAAAAERALGPRPSGPAITPPETGSAPAIPASFARGRYAVERKLGEGGKGVVFLCQDTALKRRVAVKLIKSEVMDADSLARFEREVEAMARLVHPNVVTVFDIGQEDGRYYLVLELMDGGDVERLIKNAKQHRLDSATAVSITMDAARGLAHAHDHGIVHRDIKPGNIWLTLDGLAKLGDFGLAYLGGSTRLTRAGMMVGTVAYMAPEVALGKHADARADLYMLGASLYEMVTGKVPFPGDDPVKVIFSHINDPVLTPRRHAPDLPDALEMLILQLLAKDPEHRPAAALDVLRALESLPGVRAIESGPGSVRTVAADRGDAGVLGRPRERGPHGLERDASATRAAATSADPSTARAGEIPADLSTARSADIAAQRPGTPDPRFPRPLVGRDHELTALRHRVDGLVQGQGGLVFITGEAGIGKTRLAAELRGYARARGCQWLEGRYEQTGSIAMQPYVEAVRMYLRTAVRTALPALASAYAPELSRAFPDLGAALGVSPSMSPPPMEDPQAVRQRQLDAICHLFLGIARQQPLVLFLDDLQWASSMDLLHALAQRAQPEPLLLVGAFRDAELREHQPLSSTLLAMNRVRIYEAIPLHRLTRDATAALVAAMLGQTATPELVDLVHQRSEGNPFFTEELVRLLIDEEALQVAGGQWAVKDASTLRLPDSVRAVVGERLARLGPETRRVLTLASVIGKEFDLALLTAVADLKEDALLDVLDEALRVHVLVERPGLGREVYGFTDAQVRQALYEEITAPRRRRYHARLGEAMERLYPRRLDEHAATLAHHFIQGMDVEKAIIYSIKAGDAASSQLAHPRARQHYGAAIELLEEKGEESERTAHVHAQLGGRLVRHAIGSRTRETQQDLGHLNRAITLFTAAGNRRRAAMLYRVLAPQYISSVGVEHDLDVALRHYQAAVDLLATEPDCVEKAVAVGGLGYCLAVRLDLARSEEQARNAVRIAESLRDRDVMAVAHVYLAVALAWTGRLRDSLASVESAWAFAQQARTVWYRHQATAHPIIVFPWLANVAHYTRLYARWETVQRETPSPRYERAISVSMAYVSAQSGKPEQARRHLTEAPQGISGGSPASQAWTILGDWNAAQAALDLHHGIDGLPGVRKNAARGRTLLARAEHAEAEALVSTACELCHDRGAITPELHLLPLLAEARVRLGRLDDAHPCLERAAEILAMPEDWWGLAAGVAHTGGLLAAAERRWDDAEAAFRRAVEINEKNGLVYDKGRAFFEWAVSRLERNLPGDREQGMDLLDRALAVFEQCQASKDVERALARKEVLKA